MCRASGGSNKPHWIRNNILDFQRAIISTELTILGFQYMSMQYRTQQQCDNCNAVKSKEINLAAGLSRNN